MAALIVAIVAACVALVSLGWQVIAFALTGPRLNVTLREAFRSPLTGGVLATSPRSIVGGVAKLDELGYSEHVLLVGVVNRGRIAATVERWTLRFGNGATYVHPAADPTNPPTPTRLEPHSSTTYYAPVEWLQRYQVHFTSQSRRAKRIRAVIGVAGRSHDLTSRFAYRVDSSGVHEHGRWVLRKLGWGYRWVRSKLP